MTSLLVVLTLLSAAALLAGGGRVRRGAALGLAVLALVVPFVPSGATPLMRFMVALTAFWATVRVVDVSSSPGTLWWGARLWHVFAAFDTRACARVPPQFDARLLLDGVSYAALGGVGLLLVTAAHHLDGLPHALLRWWGGATFVYGLAGMLAAIFRCSYLLLGIALPPLHHRPIASRSLREFWGARWNRVVGRWLRQIWFLPLARRGRGVLGLVLAFAVSAFMHGYMTMATGGLSLALPMTAFFLIQLGLLVIERAVRLERAPMLVQRVWFFTAMACSLPLFVEPILLIVLPTAR